MAAQAGLCQAWSETPEDTFSHDEAHMFKYIVGTHYNPLHRNKQNYPLIINNYPLYLFHWIIITYKETSGSRAVYGNKYKEWLGLLSGHQR